jgi:hypothetical protein
MLSWPTGQFERSGVAVNREGRQILQRGKRLESIGSRVRGVLYEGCYREFLVGVNRRPQADGAFHSRIMEKRIPVAKSTKTKSLFRTVAHYNP